jgi:hypothetical protein
LGSATKSAHVCGKLPLLTRSGQVFTRLYKHAPHAGEVALNLERLYDDPEFENSVQHWEREGHDYSKGIRRYGGNQHEVILTVAEVRHEEIYALGGNAGELWRDIHVLGASPGDDRTNAQVLEDAGLPTRRWIYDASVRTVYANFLRRGLGVVNPHFAAENAEGVAPSDPWKV